MKRIPAKFTKAFRDQINGFEEIAPRQRMKIRECVHAALQASKTKIVSEDLFDNFTDDIPQA